MNFKEIAHEKVRGKKVLLRSCFDVPIKNGRITDDTRIKSAIPTIKHLLDGGASIILISKMGRPGGKVVPELSLEIIAPALSGLLDGREVKFVNDALGVGAKKATQNIKPGEIILLENLRFYAGEEENDSNFAKTLASYADLFVMDDFPNVKNDHAGITGVTKFIPAFAGINFALEINTLFKAFENPKKPLIAIIGGAKVSTKIDVLKALIKKVDVLIVGGGMANTFLAAEGYEVGKSLYESDFLDSAEEITRLSEEHGVELILPDDVVTAKAITDTAKTTQKSIDEIEKNDIIVDIGPNTISKYAEPLKFAGTIFWNGPVGINEHKNFAKGTVAVAKIIASSQAQSIIGGGDTVSAVSGMGLSFDFVSTGGGATLELISGQNLPGLEALGKSH